MARADRAAADPVKPLEQLQSEPYRFDLYQALRWLECAHPDRPRWGESRHVQDDPLRLGQEPSLAFAPSILASYHPGTDDRPARLRVFYPGLFGPNGPLPFHLTEFARERQANEGDSTFSRFADVFHHRMIALFYRAWASAQPAVQYDRPEADRIALLLGALIGMGSPTLRRRGAGMDRALLHHAGGLAIPTRHAEGLSRLLANFFEADVEVLSFVGHWIDLPPDDQCRLGDASNATLGRTATVGNRVWDCQHKFRVVFGPLGFEDYRRLLPGSPSLERLLALVRSYAGDDLFWDANVILKKEEVPPLVLGGPGQLGWTTWLQTRPAERDSGELMLDPAAHAA
jgi:type VI secretion system protein ImpH